MSAKIDFKIFAGSVVNLTGAVRNTISQVDHNRIISYGKGVVAWTAGRLHFGFAKEALYAWAASKTSNKV